MRRMRLPANETLLPFSKNSFDLPIVKLLLLLLLLLLHLLLLTSEVC